MGEPAFQTEFVSEEEYLTFEEASETRHEYWHGEIRAMAGALLPHITLTAQISRSLGNRLEGTSCQAGTGDLAVKEKSEGFYFYPDVVVVCDDAEFDERYPAILLTPVVIAEVLSSSTASIDQGLKLQSYLKIPSLSDYLIVSTERISITHYTRRDDNSWSYLHYDRRSQIVQLPRIGVEIPVQEIYQRLDVPETLRLVQDPLPGQE